MARNIELSEFLHRSRARLSPEEAGLPTRVSIRRVPGLRREEVAFLANVSTDYYTRLEQGKPARPSTAVLDAIADALQLDQTERTHLFDLVRPSESPSPQERRAVQRVRPGPRRMLDSFTDQAGFILGRRTEILATNHLCRALIADFDAMPHRERNLTRWVLLEPEARSLFADWKKVAEEMTATLRLDVGRHPDDARTAELVGELAMKSDHFRNWWADHRVFDRTWGSKRLHHPMVGDLSIDYQAFALPGEAEQTLYLYIPTADQASQDAWKLLLSWSAQAEPAFTPAGDAAAQRLG